MKNYVHNNIINITVREINKHAAQYAATMKHMSRVYEWKAVFGAANTARSYSETCE
jgi:hypothetical protein